MIWLSTTPRQRSRALLSPGFWRGYSRTLRPYLMPVSAAAGALGLALAPALGFGSTIAALFAFGLVYGLGQALTDTTQIDTDSLSAPDRPLVRGEITPGEVTTVSLIGLALCGVIFASLNPWTLLVSCVAVAGLAVYTPFKRRWWSGPPWNAWIVGTLPIIGMLCGGVGIARAASSPTTWLAFGSVALSYIPFVVLGYFKDTRADRATGYDTIVVHFGRGVAVAVSAVTLVGALTCSALLLGQAGFSLEAVRLGHVPGLLCWLVGIGLLFWAHIAMLPVRRDEDAYRGVAACVAGFVFLHAGEIGLVRPAWSVAALVLAIAGSAAIRARPTRTQV